MARAVGVLMPRRGRSDEGRGVTPAPGEREEGQQRRKGEEARESDSDARNMWFDVIGTGRV